jgi:predicted RND superfamily exporter protein
VRALTAFALRHSLVVVTAFALATAFFATRAIQTTTDGSTDALYPPESAAAILADELAVDFAQGDRLLLVVEGDVWGAEGLAALRDLTRTIDRLEGTRDVTSLATAKRLEDDDGFLIVGDLIPTDLGDAAAIADARRYLEGAAMYQDVVFVDDAGRRASLILEYDGSIDAAAYARAVADATDATWPGEHALAGAAFTTMELRAIIARDLPVLGATALALILIMLWVNFRTLRRVALAFVQIVLGVVWGMGIFQVLGQELMALTVIGPIAVMAVGASFSMHLLGRYDYELARGTEKLEALRRTFERTGLGVLVSGLAISAAMSTFLLSDLAMVRGLGLVAALGVLASLLAALVLLPALLRLLPDPKRVPDPEAPGRIRGLLAGLAALVTRRPKVVMGVAAVLVVGALLGIARIQADTSILAFFPADGATRQSVRTVEETLGGSSVVQVRVDGDILDPEVLAALEAFQAEAKTLPEVGGAQSITQVMRAIHQTLTGEDGLPPTRQAAAQELLLYTSSGDAAELAKLLTLDERSAVVNLVVQSGSTTRGRAVLADLERMAEATLGGRTTYGFTGQAVLELAVEDAMRHDFLISLTLAIVLVLAIDSLVRSFRAAAVTILALVATIALQYGLLGWAGIPLNLATMLMGALAIGVGDYAIHLTVRYMEERARGRGPEDAVGHAVITSGRQILFTATTLGVGFFALTFADFVPVATLGWLMVLTVALVGVATLTLLPAVALVAFRDPGGRAAALATTSGGDPA